MVVVAAAPSPAAGAPKVLLLPGQPAAAAAAAAGAPAGRALPLMLPGQRGASPEAAGEGPPQARKRQRLTHLSPEEKALRRKLKNRVAAQTARDRKKARMSELEQQVVDLEEENQKLLLENQLLREKTNGLVIENQELRQRLGMDALGTEEEAEAKGNGVRPVAGSAESAALRLRAPLQQVQAQLSPLHIISPWILTAWTLQTLRQKYKKQNSGRSKKQSNKQTGDFSAICNKRRAFSTGYQDAWRLISNHSPLPGTCQVFLQKVSASYQGGRNPGNKNDWGMPAVR